jgi:hypothetical protein
MLSMFVVAMCIPFIAAIAQTVDAVSTAPWMSKEFMGGIILILTPIIIWLIDKIPWIKLPSWTYPILAPLLGMALNWLDSLSGAASLVWYQALLVGFGGIGVREMKSQIGKRITGESAKAITA